MSGGPATRVADSVEAAIGALEQLVSSLRRGGFEEGAPAYARMAEVVVAQRMMHDPDDAALVARFGHLGSLAREVFELLEPYTLAMRRLAAMAPERPDRAAKAAIVAQLERRGRRGATASVLARAARLPHDLTAQVLAALVADGTVVRRTTGDVESFGLLARTHRAAP